MLPILLDSPLVSEGDWFRDKQTVNLLGLWDNLGEDKKIKIKQIGELTKWMKKYVSDSSSSFLESMECSHILLISTIQEESYPVSQQGGPLISNDWKGDQLV